MNLQEIVKLAFAKHTPNQPYLLAMSAGIDSTALFHILLELGINFSVAHANFGLRGTDSENDETFVKTLCSKNNIPFYSKTMDVLKFKKENNDSTQSAARKLRYQWFYELLDQHKLSQIITAHHLNDSAETFFINLLRGTGINGLTGIENQVKIFRPFLNVTSNQIKEYVEKQNITWREDYTNTEETYVRNKIRHNIIPTLEKIQPHFLANFHKTIQFLQDDIAIIQQSVAALRKRIFIIEEDFTQISVAELNQIQNDNLIYYLFEPFGFNYPQEIKKLLAANESAEIQSNTHRLIKNREKLILKKNSPLQNLKKFILNDLENIENPVRLSFQKFKHKPDNSLPTLDLNKIKFPLYLRLWQIGDSFQPLGMNGKTKKVSKFYKDLKFSKIQKENTWLLCDASNQIIWVVGYRFNHRFAATKDTETWLQIKKLD